MIETRARTTSIRKKLMRTFGIAVTIIVICCLAVSAVSVITFRKNTIEQMTEQAMSSGEVFTAGLADTIGAQMQGTIDALYESRDYIENIYKYRDEYPAQDVLLPEELPAITIGNQMYWRATTEEEESSEEILAEAQLLGNAKAVFSTIMDNNDLVAGLYVSTKTHVSVDYDSNVKSWKSLGTYDPEKDSSHWYQKAIRNEKLFVSEAYNDEYGRGLMFTMSVPFYVDGEVYGAVGADILISNVRKLLRDVDTGHEGGYAMLFTKSGKTMAAPEMNGNINASVLLGGGSNVSKILFSESGSFETDIQDVPVYIFHHTVDETGWVLTVVLPTDSILSPVEESISMIKRTSNLQYAILVVVLALALITVSRLSKSLTTPLAQLTEDVEHIAAGNLEYESRIHTGDELETLSVSFQNMTYSLRSYIDNIRSITAEKERIGAELDVAAHIQSSMLPCIFPAFPERKEIDIYATMNPAKEVGGDFYDFFMIDDRHVAIVMADVSGKGVPAALFMVIGKTLIKDHSQAGLSAGEVFSKVNNLLCESNSEGLFITAFEGVLDIVTGEFVYVNAGHEMPFICKKSEKFAPYKIRPGFVLAGMEDMRYKAGSIMLEPGDKVFQYTDGVTEATDANNQLYGMERLEAVLGRCSSMTPQEILPVVKADIDAFVGEAPQFDDITMLCLEYKERMNPAE